MTCTSRALCEGHLRFSGPFVPFSRLGHLLPPAVHRCCRCCATAALTTVAILAGISVTMAMDPNYAALQALYKATNGDNWLSCVPRR